MTAATNAAAQRRLGVWEGSTFRAASNRKEAEETRIRCARAQMECNLGKGDGQVD